MVLLLCCFVPVDKGFLSLLNEKACLSLVSCSQQALLKETPVLYNKPDMLNPFFVVFGKRREATGEAQHSEQPQQQQQQQQSQQQAAEPSGQGQQ